MQQPPLFPFGHGLSFTEFEYSNLIVSAVSRTGVAEPRVVVGAAGAPVAPSHVPQCGSVSVSFTVTNVGDSIAGDEVTFLWGCIRGTRAASPRLDLLAFGRTGANFVSSLFFLLSAGSCLSLVVSFFSVLACKVNGLCEGVWMRMVRPKPTAPLHARALRTHSSTGCR